MGLSWEESGKRGKCGLDILYKKELYFQLKKEKINSKNTKKYSKESTVNCFFCC